MQKNTLVKKFDHDLFFHFLTLGINQKKVHKTCCENGTAATEFVRAMFDGPFGNRGDIERVKEGRGEVMCGSVLLFFAFPHIFIAGLK